MEYKLITLDEKVAYGKNFEFPTSEIQTYDYSKLYGEVCKGMNPTVSYGIYQVGEQTTKFTVAIETEVENDYTKVTLPAGDYYEFELDMMENMKENEYVKCFDTLTADGISFDMSYSYEVMDRSFNPMTGNFKFKYYIKAL